MKETEPPIETPAEEEGVPAPPAVAVIAARPPGTPEFTVRAILVAIFVAAIIGGSYPYVVMKLGFGPNISVVSAFFGYLALGIVITFLNRVVAKGKLRRYNRWENNIVQTAGTSAGQTAFLCVLMAAFDMLRQDPSLHFHIQLTPLQSFVWLTTAGSLGVFLAVPMRRHFVVDEKLTFADGIAAAETLVVLDSTGPEARATARSMGLGTFVSAVLMCVREDARLLAASLHPIPEMTLAPYTFPSMGVGVSWSLLSLGSGMLVGMRINASMMMGMVTSWIVAPVLLHNGGIVPELTRKNVLMWVMWPATGMLISGGLTALGLRWRLLIETFRGLSRAHVGGDDFPMRWVYIGTGVCTIALVIVQHTMLGMPFWMTLVAVVLSVPLMLVGLRVLGETNWGPISALSNMMQAVFGVIAPGQIAPNMIASGVTGSVATQSEGLMQDFKTGDMIGSTPRFLTYAQLIAIPVGAGAVSLVYPLLRDTYGIGGEHGLQSPISQKWAGFAKLLSGGLSALPPGALWALGVAVVLGIVFTVMESTKWKKWTPSPTGIGIGMLVPASAIITMFLGGVAEQAWRAMSKETADRHLTPLASGLIAGEAIVAVVIPILVAVGILSLQ